MPNISVRLFPLAAVLFAVPLLAQTATPLASSPFDGAAFSMSASVMQSAAAGVAADKRSDATILYEETDYRISTTGNLDYVVRLIYRVETSSGVRNWAEASMGWDPWYQNAAEIHARILQTDGTFVTLDPKTITDSPIDSGEEETYTSARVRKAPLPGISIGSIVEEVVSVDEKRPYIAAGSVYRCSFANSVVTERQKVVVELPSSMPFQDSIANLPKLSVTRSNSNGMRRIVYEEERRPAMVSGDIELDSATTPIPRIEFSTGSTWASVAKAYAALSDPSIALDQVRSLLPPKPKGDRMATVRLLVARLHKEVRYTGVEFNAAQLIPQEPSVVLKRHYGDCKDKATLLVAMLRAEKIPAYLALLSAGTGSDVNPKLPGMNRFNHAIVYVPAAGKEPAMWIDATAEFHEAGTLPYGDAGRFALVIAPETTGLTKTPDPSPENSVLTETRTFTLSELGASRIVESSETHGDIDASYRSTYGSTATKRITDYLDRYGRQTYLAKSLVKLDHGDGSNLTKPFQLTLTYDGARRGFTSLDDAVVAIFPSGTLSGLPTWITTAPTPLSEDATPQQKQERADREEQRSPTYNIRPFVAEQRYRILVPAGFTLRGLPADRTTPLGPGSLTEHYAQESPRLVTATLHFTTGKSCITAQEALSFRQAVADLYKRDVVTIVFEQTGVKLLAEGKIKEALAADQDTLAQNPKSALPHVRLARALLQVGVGEMARNEAARAVEFDPKSPAALITQGWVLQHDMLGNRFGTGFDRAGAIAAYQKAILVHTEDFDPRFDLAVLYEHDAKGVGYSPDANLPDAISIYRTLIEEDKKKDSSDLAQHRANLGYALLFNRNYKQVDALLPDIPPGANHSTLAIASAVAQKDVAAGLAEADRLNLSAGDRNHALISAGNDLAHLGLYPQAASIFSAGIQGGTDAPVIARRIEIFRNLHRVPLASPPITTPESVVFACANIEISGRADRALLAPLFSRHAFANEDDFEHNIDKNVSFTGSLYSLARNQGQDEAVLRDIILGSKTLKSTGGDATGYRVISQTIGDQARQFFVVREDGTYRIVADGIDNVQVGNFALYALDHNQLPLAKSILDWKRELVHKGGGDDPLSGPFLPRFWTVGSLRPGADSPESMRLAAISLIDGSMDAKPYLASLVPLRDQATGSSKSDLNLLLAWGYVGSEQPKTALPFIDELLQEEPDSNRALGLAATAYSMSGDPAASGGKAAWKALLAPRLMRRPGDPVLLRTEVRMQVAQHDYAGARLSLKSVFDSGNANSEDYNNYAWLGLFDGHLGPDITEAAQQANMMTKNSNFADLHTLACIYAAQGKVTEAKQGLKQAMAAGQLSQPDSSVWYALGLLYEDYGLSDAALAAYTRVKAHEWDDRTFVDPESAYILAQKRIAILATRPRSTPSGL